MRKVVTSVLTFLCLLALTGQGRAGSLDSLIQSIAAADNQQLSKLTFLELNILKNAIFSAKGFKYADDRTWLNEYFYGINIKIDSLKFQNQSKSDSLVLLEQSIGVWNLPVMEKAIANVRVALFKKIKSFNNSSSIDATISNDFGRHHFIATRKVGLIIMGRVILHYGGEYSSSLCREAQGYRCLLDIIETKRDFDACELLGVYVGSVVMLKNIIEAQNGKIFDGTMGWEISQLAGITPRNEHYDENNLDIKVKLKLILLDTIIKKMTNSGIGDVPAQFKNEGINVDLYYEEGC
jgi:hypothetical protein